VIWLGFVTALRADGLGGGAAGEKRRQSRRTPKVLVARARVRVGSIAPRCGAPTTADKCWREKIQALADMARSSGLVKALLASSTTWRRCHHSRSDMARPSLLEK
jgi:hypothetical protein